ncbi:glycoside hydrolase family 3 N-terminal domain-containing protein [Dysgonomonas macrotermitis]|uniref:beta-N-acetylhexosaminidase n=1 Tax=Dysgonomonas macrotermitis TaxID=1346286 RepID=A0A1M4W3C0_9BACT|nr:glycoside hydrolase family 3 N-terminal domain-containing protein [Dysgonomonas macrotermitis]SHE75603.1 beta-glucosidase [Dysgonomonas macrotermitis]
MFKKLTLNITFLLLVTISVFSKNKIEPTLMKQADKYRMQQWVDSVYNQMTPDERIGQLIIIHVPGDNTDANRKRITNLVKNIYAGGILFSKGTPTNQAELTNLAQSNAKIPLMVTADAEWGLSMRLSNTTRFPKNMMLGAVREDTLIYRYGLEMARQSKLAGIQVNFAPDVDVNSNPDNPVIGMRSFGEDPDKVAEWGIVYAKGVEDGGVLPVAKHFPGHGDTSADSHKTLPLITHNKDRLDDIELLPFKKYIKEGLASVMIAHLNVPALDASGAPSSLSKPVITDLLKNEMGFTGLIFTDGLAMQGVAKETDMSLRALQAGNDLLLGPIYPEKEFNALKAAFESGSLSGDLVEERCKKVLQYKYLLGLNNYSPIDVLTLESRLNTSYSEWLARKLNEKAMTLLKNEDKVIPFKNLEKRKIAAVSLGAPANNSFLNTLKQYGDVTCFSATSAADVAKIKSQLSGFNTVIVSIHTTGAFSNSAVDSLIEGKESVVTFLVSPYLMSKYTQSIKKASGVLMAYENTPFGQEYAAQALFGGNAVRGKLPVTVAGLYDAGTGIKTSKIRLAYNLPEEVGVRSSKLDKIEDIVKEGIAAQAFPGCEILVAKDGVVIYNRAFGSFQYDNKRPVTESDIYDLASMTKASATIPAIMKLYDDKKITLQTPLSTYVKQLQNTDKSNITIRQALFHETGLPSFIQYYLPAIDQDSYSGRLISYRQIDGYPALIDNGAWARNDFKYKPDLISTTSKPGFTRQIADNLYINDVYNDTIVQRIADSKLRAKKSYLYSCLNFMLLKEVTEKVSKTDLNTFLQDNFYRKLGATTTTYNPLTKFDKSVIAPTEQDDFLRKQLLQGYVHDEGAAFLGGISGNAGLFSNANDLAKLFQMWLDGGTYGDERYLSKETVRLFTMTKSPNSRRGLGFDKPDMQSSKSSPTSPSAPASVYGHTGFTGTCFWIDPDNDLIYIFLSNRVNPSRTHKELMKLNIRPRIQEIIYSAIK